MVEYKGYLADVVFDPEIGAFHGTVVNINDVITFYGSSVTELREEMQKSIEAYFAFCICVLQGTGERAGRTVNR